MLFSEVLFYIVFLVFAILSVGSGIILAFWYAGKKLEKNKYLEDQKARSGPTRSRIPITSSEEGPHILRSRVAERSEIQSYAAIDSEFDDVDVTDTLSEMRQESNEAYSFLANENGSATAP